MKIIYDKDSGIIMGHGSGDLVENDTQGLTDPPEGFDMSRISLYKVDVVSEEMVFKEGQDLIDATTALQGQLRSKLISQYAGKALNPVTLGNLEGATDILVHFMNRLITDGGITAEEQVIWDSFYSKVSPEFKTKVEDIANEEDGLAAAKAAARQSEIAMKADPNWNI